MADIVMPDTSVFGEINRGNGAVARELQQLAQSGKIILPYSVHRELLNCPDPVLRAAQLELVRDLRLPVQDPQTMADRVDRYDASARLKGSVSVGFGGDTVVMADVQNHTLRMKSAGKTVTFWTMERMGKNGGIQKQYGITFDAKLNSLPSHAKSPMQDYATVRGLFRNLPTITIDSAGRVTRPPAGGGGSSNSGGGSNPPPAGGAAKPNAARTSGSGSANPWLGANGATRIQGLAGALDMLNRWAETLSMWNAFQSAVAELQRREDEIIAAQNENPLYPVYIRIYWRVLNENNPNLYKRYDYFGADVANGCGGQPRSLYDADQHSYLMVIPPLKSGAEKVTPAASITWRDRYVYVVSALRGGRSVGGDPVEALRILNGCSMHDILAILKKLKTDESFLYDRMQQAIFWPSANVGRERLTAAFVAIRMSDSAGAFHAYAVACEEFSHLPADQKKTIEEFLSPTVSKALTSPAGEWTVRVANWIWIYKFDDKGDVTWRDPHNGRNGKGKWRNGGGTIKIDWTASKTVDEWTTPLDAKAQSGKVRMDGKVYALSATKA